MTDVARRLFLVLFALLQCLAPLLHAHASAQPHGGLHLPEWMGVSNDGPAQAASGHTDATVHAAVAIVAEAKGLDACDPAPFLGAGHWALCPVGSVAGHVAWGLYKPPHTTCAWLHSAPRAPPCA